MKKRTLNNSSAALIVIDIQEAFRKSIPGLDKVIAKTRIAIKAFGVFNLPVLITEQYPKGLGHTVPELKEISENASYFEKSHFSACGCGPFNDILVKEDIQDVLIAGIETHVCVNQTVHDLLEAGKRVHILEDAVASRKPDDRETALKKMYSSGAIPSSVEMALFELLVDSKSPDFKQIQSLIR
jgi:nicotinamidase-related amidase